ncbi:leucyl aminopeptidase [Terasakiispira papahanaumokuakeensis]|uniref:Probable cytosol aminopeptidase n=1 Tax=Terasakiispira papahanaumokuakeensis TaxID=197479 RepID=A0A1E2V5T9_9GAMM|nr:leucyl aminopeptidase [Terasakiispira papahanaumokuakeensis]ODC02341.1 leucyl aminopeptidase [Terasakiispira papahanaumokuakeensis]
MEFKLLSQSPANQSTACLVIPVGQDGQLTAVGEQVDKATESLVRQTLDRGDFKGKLGQTFLLPFAPGLKAERLLLVGYGDADKLTESRFRKMVQASASALLALNIHDALVTLADTPVLERAVDWRIRLISETFLTSRYRFTEFKSQPEPEPGLTEVALWLPAGEDEAIVAQGLAIGEAIGSGRNFTRTLADRPANLCTPRHLADVAAELVEGDDRFKLTVLDEAQMAELGMNSLLAVGQGSDEPSRLVVIEYRGADDPEAAPHALVGKGITFDSGGISLKPGAGMDEMKYDMGGAASVLGTCAAVKALAPKINLVAVLACAENMPSGRANKPGDILKTMSGKTVEVLNTDAEGRLVLCDALTYVERYQPTTVVDIATLTGACIMALGHHATGLLANDDDLALSLLEAGEMAEDRAWHLPLWEEFQEQLDSNFADMQNIGGRPAGTITAGCFLSRFAENFTWAHLDIAGTAWVSGKAKGATGRPVGLLTQHLLDRAQEENTAEEKA